MSTQVFVASNAETALDRFAQDVRRGLGGSGQKWIPATYLYDAVGSAIFDAITLLPEYGLTRADESLLRRYAPEVAARCRKPVFVAELGSGSGSKTRPILLAFGSAAVPYYPIDVSLTALERCVGELERFAEVRPVQGSYFEGLQQVLEEREPGSHMLLLFLGSTIGNFHRGDAVSFLAEIRRSMSAGDHLLIGADLVKPVPQMLAAYDDPAGLTAAFNRNVLARMNRELGANFDLHAFDHEARWSAGEQRIEMHLRAQYQHRVQIPLADVEIRFDSGETIWTESSYKFTTGGLRAMAASAGFREEECWVNDEWAFAECLWTA
jgi:L-histidine Nalpha-methyltransferase